MSATGWSQTTVKAKESNPMTRGFLEYLLTADAEEREAIIREWEAQPRQDGMGVLATPATRRRPPIPVDTEGQLKPIEVKCPNSGQTRVTAGS